MENPLTKAGRQNMRDNREESRLNKQLKAETGALENFDALEEIQNNDEFAQFLIGIEPGYANLDLSDKKNVALVKEKFVLFEQQERMRTGVQDVYKDEIVKELNIDLPEGALGPAMEKIGAALRELAQKDTLEFQRLRSKLETYAQVKKDLLVLETKFAEKVNLTGKEGVAAMKDRQVKLEQASGKVFSREGAAANFGRIWGNTNMEAALADLKHSYGQVEKDNLGAETKVSGGDIKQATELRAKLEELRGYLLQDLKIGTALIEATQAEAKRILNAQTAEISGNIDRLDVLSKEDRSAHRDALVDRAKRENWGVGKGPEKEEGELRRIAELDELDDLETMTTASLDAPKKERLSTLRTQQSGRMEQRMARLEAAHKLVTKMAEGKGKKGGIDYTQTQVVETGEGTAAEMLTVKDLLDRDRVGMTKELVSQLEKMVKQEVKLVIERAAMRSDRLQAFKEQINPFVEKWQLGGLNSRDKVKDFMTETMTGVLKSPNVNPVLKVQIKAFMAQRGMNVASVLGGGGRYEVGGFSYRPVLAT